LGPCLLESVYEKCFARELFLKGLNYQEQQNVPVHYKGVQLDAELRFDVLVESLIITELKSSNTSYIHETTGKTQRNSDKFQLHKYFQGRSKDAGERILC
jgi:GxxExxY protein